MRKMEQGDPDTKMDHVSETGTAESKLQMFLRQNGQIKNTYQSPKKSKISENLESIIANLKFKNSLSNSSSRVPPVPINPSMRTLLNRKRNLSPDQQDSNDPPAQASSETSTLKNSFNPTVHTGDTLETSRYFVKDSNGQETTEQFVQDLNMETSRHFLQDCDRFQASKYFEHNSEWLRNMQALYQPSTSMVVSPLVGTTAWVQSNTSVQSVKGRGRREKEEKIFQCGFCQKQFSRSDKLNRHYLIHTGEKAWKCEVCQKSFSRPDKLRRHHLVHTGVKAWKCDICEKAFAHRDKLRLHTLVHTGEKPWKCKLCDKAFNRSDRLKAHTLLHTQNAGMGWNCGVCAQTFTRASSLKRHMSMHAVKPGTCSQDSALC